MQTILSSVRLSSLDGRKSGYDVIIKCDVAYVSVYVLYQFTGVCECFVSIFYLWYRYRVNKLSFKKCNLNSEVVVLTDTFTRRAPNKNNVSRF